MSIQLLKQIKISKIGLFLFFLLPISLAAQFSLNNALDDINYANPKTYEIGGITVSGAEFLVDKQ